MRRFLLLFAMFPALLRAQEVREEITVERVIVDTRVTDYQGDPITGLGISDFKVKIDGKPAVVESVLWVPENAAAREQANVEKIQVTPDLESMDMPAPQGRLLVFFVQTDFARNSSRIAGQMKFLPYADQMIDGLEPEDRVAVLQYDSHLKFRLDFSDDKEEIRRTIRDALEIDDPQWPQRVPLPALGSFLEQDELRAVASPEKALLVIANALRNIPGPKSLILFGWGLGYKVGDAVVMGPDYWIAKRAMEAARVTVFSLDMSIADYHTLEAGLKLAAADTGGFYSKTHVFPQIAVDRLKRTLAGHYELEVRKPEKATRGGTHAIEVTVTRRGSYVMARTSYAD